MLARRLNGNGKNRILFVPPPKDAFLALTISPNECATRPMHVSSSYLVSAIDVQRARSFRADEHEAIATP